MTKQEKYWLYGSLAAVFLLIPKKTNNPMFSAIKSKLTSFMPPHEGFSATPYWDYKQWSWGYGTRVPGSINNPSARPTGTITRAKAMEELLKHVEKDYLYLKGLVKTSLTTNQWAAYLSFSYNLGTGNADNLLANLNSRNWTALESQWKQYINAGGAPSQALIRRRADEWNLFVS